MFSYFIPLIQISCVLPLLKEVSHSTPCYCPLPQVIFQFAPFLAGYPAFPSVVKFYFDVILFILYFVYALFRDFLIHRRAV